jgi:hypothetical protein
MQIAAATTISFFFFLIKNKNGTNVGGDWRGTYHMGGSRRSSGFH